MPARRPLRRAFRRAPDDQARPTPDERPELDPAELELAGEAGLLEASPGLERDPAAPPEDPAGPASWELEEGEEIAPGRSVLRSLGGCRRFEVFLVWDEHLYSLVVPRSSDPTRPTTRARGASSRRRPPPSSG